MMIDDPIGGSDETEEGNEREHGEDHQVFV